MAAVTFYRITELEIPSPPEGVFFLRAGDGFDLFVSDATGVPYKLNPPAINSAVLDFGRMRQQSKTFTIPHGSVIPTSVITVAAGNYLQTDENNDEDYTLQSEIGTGQFFVTISALPKQFLQGQFKINYSVSL